MKKIDITTVPDYYRHYINLAGEGNLMEELMSGGLQQYVDHAEHLEQLGDKVYAEGKWTARQIIEHLIDTERLFQARALRIGRGDQTPIPGYNENFYADHSRSNEIPLRKLLSDYRLVRSATISLFSNFNEEELKRCGIANDQKISVLAIGFILVGHPVHHFKVLKERYFPLI